MYFDTTYVSPGWQETTIAEMVQFARDHRETLTKCTRLACFPADLYREMGQRGWVGPMTAVEFGGLGGSAVEYCLIEEEVGRLGLVSPQISIQGQLWLSLWGSDGQKDRYLRRMAAGDLIFAEAISEPAMGSSFKLMQATARRAGGDWVLSGRKTHVNLGHQAGLLVVYALTEAGASTSMTAFLVETDAPGLTTRQTEAIGLRLIPTADVDLDEVRIPSSAILGEPGRGLQTFLSTFNISRLGNASELIGFGRRALAEAIAYAQGRQVDDLHKAMDFQGLQWTVADAYGKLYAASLARDRAAMLARSGSTHDLETTLAKKLAVDAAEYAVNECFALIGGHGLYEDTPFRQILCDMKVLRVAGGSLEILRNYIARRVLKSHTYEGLA